MNYQIKVNWEDGNVNDSFFDSSDAFSKSYMIGNNIMLKNIDIKYAKVSSCYNAFTFSVVFFFLSTDAYALLHLMRLLLKHKVQQ